MHGIVFSVNFEKEVLNMVFSRFAFFHRGKNKMSETMGKAQQMNLLKIFESKLLYHHISPHQQKRKNMNSNK